MCSASHLLRAHRASLQGLCQHSVWGHTSSPQQCSDLYHIQIQNTNHSHLWVCFCYSTWPLQTDVPDWLLAFAGLTSNPLVTCNSTQWPYTDKCCTDEDFCSKAWLALELSEQDRKHPFKTTGRICDGEQLFARKRISPKPAVRNSSQARTEPISLQNNKKFWQLW